MIKRIFNINIKTGCLLINEDGKRNDRQFIVTILLAASREENIRT
jgi:hypothetical protein